MEVLDFCKKDIILEEKAQILSSFYLSPLQHIYTNHALITFISYYYLLKNEQTNKQSKPLYHPSLSCHIMNVHPYLHVRISHAECVEQPNHFFSESS